MHSMPKNYLVCLWKGSRMCPATHTSVNAKAGLQASCSHVILGGVEEGISPLVAPVSSRWPRDQPALQHANCIARELVHGGLVLVQDWRPNNPTFTPSSAEFKIVAKTTERTLKLSIASALVQGAALCLVLKLQICHINSKYQAESQHLHYQNPSCLSGRWTPTSHNYFKTPQDLTKQGLRRNTGPF